MIYKQPRQDLDLCGNSFARYSEKCSTQIYRALYGAAMLVPRQMGTNMAAVKLVTETSVIEFCHRNEILLLTSSETSKLILLLGQQLFS